MATREETAVVVTRYNKILNTTIEMMESQLKKLEEFKVPFQEQKNLKGRLEMAKKIILSAGGQLDSTRPRIFMIMETEDDIIAANKKKDEERKRQRESKKK